MSDTGTASTTPDPDVQNAQKVKITDAQKQAILDAANGDAQKAALVENILRTENRGFGYPNNEAQSYVNGIPTALGAFQFTHPAWVQFGQGDYEKNARDFDASVNAASRMVDWISRKYSSEPGVVGAYYNGGWRAAEPVSVGMDPPTQQSKDYVRIMRGLSQPQDADQADPTWAHRLQFQ